MCIWAIFNLFFLPLTLPKTLPLTQLCDHVCFSRALVGSLPPLSAWLAGCGASQPIAGAGSETCGQLTSCQKLGPCLSLFRLRNKILQTVGL